MIKAPEFVTNAITAIGIIARLVPITIAFHALAAFFPTHAPAIVGRMIVISVRGICSAPAALVDAPITCMAPIGA